MGHKGTGGYYGGGGPRLEPLGPPYEPGVEEALRKWMPPGAVVEPLGLFRTLLLNGRLAERMRPLGAGLLGRHSTLDPRERELVIGRVCARCGSEYEWGVHVASFGPALGIPGERSAATVSGSSHDGTWTAREATLLRLADELHETSDVSDGLWRELVEGWEARQILELVVLVGWYHLISFVANTARVEPEPWAARFPDAGRPDATARGEAW